MKKSILLFTSALVFTTPCFAPCFANDTLATLSTSGLVIEKTNKIEMVSEDLTISRKEIRVKYRFRNTTRKSIKSTVAFPLPRVRGMQAISPSLTESDGRFVQDPLRFRLKVDGKAVPVKSEGHYIDEEKLEFDFRYYWTQVFPPGREITVEHTYIPFIGTGYQSKEGSIYCAGTIVDQFVASNNKKIEADFLKHPERLKSPDDMADAVENYNHFNTFEKVDYTLTTGGNWKGPIKHFKLTLDKEHPGDVLALCFDPFMKTGKTTYVFQRENFVPTRELRILFVNHFDPKRHAGAW